MTESEFGPFVRYSDLFKLEEKYSNLEEICREQSETILRLQEEISSLNANINFIKQKTRTYLYALELYLPSSTGVLGDSNLAGALRSAEKDLRMVLSEEV